MSHDEAPTHPSPGDVCVGCVHEPNPRVAHYFFIPDGLAFVRGPGGMRMVAKWILLCDACAHEFGMDLDEALEAQRVPLGCDMRWPISLRVTIRPTLN